jgi:hypothetical protein
LASAIAHRRPHLLDERRAARLDRHTRQHTSRAVPDRAGQGRLGGGDRGDREYRHTQHNKALPEAHKSKTPWFAHGQPTPMGRRGSWRDGAPRGTPIVPAIAAKRGGPHLDRVPTRRSCFNKGWHDGSDTRHERPPDLEWAAGP